MIPIYAATGGILRYLDKDIVLTNEHHYLPIWNGRDGKRRKLKGAVVKPSLSLDMRPNSTLGIGFKQNLAKGWCYSLLDVIGSQ